MSAPGERAAETAIRPDSGDIYRFAAELVRRTHGGAGYSAWGVGPNAEVGSVLLWGQSRFLDAYLRLFLYSNDAAWLEKLRSQLDLALSQRTGSTWETTYYSEGTPYAWPVHTGNMVRVLTAAALALQDERLLVAAASALAHHEHQLKEASVRGTVLCGYFTEADAPISIRGQYLPWNMQATMALAHLELGDAIGSAADLEHASAIARSLKGQLIHLDDGVWWNYGIDSTLQARLDDVSHGALSFELISSFSKACDIFDVATLGAVVKVATSCIISTDPLLLRLRPGSPIERFLPQILLYQSEHRFAEDAMRRCVAGLLRSQETVHGLNCVFKGVILQGLSRYLQYTAG